AIRGKFIEYQVRLAELGAKGSWATLSLEDKAEVRRLSQNQEEVFDPEWAGRLPQDKIIWEAGFPQGLRVRSAEDFAYARQMPFLTEVILGPDIQEVGQAFVELLPRLRRLIVQGKWVKGLVEAFRA